jgi:glycosyltransferase involved in cell wall biosynthesis
VVLPFVSGGGIKNKLLEAAALGMPVLCSPRAVRGLTAGAAVACARRPREWVLQLLELWADAPTRQRLGAAARAWVVRDHTWGAVARRAAAGLAEAALTA